MFSDIFEDMNLIESHWQSSLTLFPKKSNSKYDSEYCFYEPLTDLAVGISNAATRRGLGKIDMYQASDLLKKRNLRSISVITGMLYAKRFIDKKTSSPTVFSKNITSTDLFFISMMLASKYLYDEGTDDEVLNSEWAEDFNIDVNDVNELEAEFLYNLDWNLYVAKDEFEIFLSKLNLRLAWLNLTLRDRFNLEHNSNGFSKNSNLSSFVELSILLGDTEFQEQFFETLQYLSKLIVALCLAYAGLLASLSLSLSVLHGSPLIMMAQPPADGSAFGVHRFRFSTESFLNQTFDYGKQSLDFVKGLLLFEPYVSSVKVNEHNSKGREFNSSSSVIHHNSLCMRSDKVTLCSQILCRYDYYY